MPANDAYRVDITPSDGTATVRLSGEIDLAAREELIDTIAPLLDAEPGRPLVVDMEAVTFLDSSGISALVTLSTQSDGALRVRNASNTVRRTLAMSGCDFLLEPSEQPT